MSDIEIETLESMQKVVGGHLEQLPVPLQNIVAFCNEDGKRLGLPKNLRATILMAGTIRTDDYIAGDFLLAGFRPSDGETIDLPDFFTADWLMAALTERVMRHVGP